MTLNPKIEELCSTHELNHEIAYIVLFSLYHDFTIQIEDSRFNDMLSTLSAIGIFKINYTNEDEKENIPHIEWFVPLYINEGIKDEIWDWVEKEYMLLFKSVKRPGITGTIAACKQKMMKFFSSHPDVRKEEVLTATKIYLKEMNNALNIKYIQRADYFITKNRLESRLEEYIIGLREQKKQQEQSKSIIL